jgi:hypothetical protein
MFFPSRFDTNVPGVIHQTWLVIAVAFIGAYISYAIRQLPTISQRKSHLLFIPCYILFLTFVLAPIRMIGFAKLADDLGWGTRSGGYGGSAGKPLEANYA